MDRIWERQQQVTSAQLPDAVDKDNHATCSHLRSVMSLLIIREPVGQIRIIVPAETVIRSVHHLLGAVLAEHHCAERKLFRAIVVVVCLLQVETKRGVVQK